MSVSRFFLSIPSLFALIGFLLLAGCYKVTIPERKDGGIGEHQDAETGKTENDEGGGAGKAGGKSGAGGKGGKGVDGGSGGFGGISGRAGTVDGGPYGGTDGFGGNSGTDGATCACSTIDECCDGCRPINDDGNCDAHYCNLYACWKIPPTGQTACYNDSTQITCSTFPCQSDGGPALCGQDAQYPHNKRTFDESTANGDVIVTDSLTGLIWQSTYCSDKNRQEAFDYCGGLNYGGYSDWRLPNIYELQNLLNYAKYSPASDFPNMPSDWFWSSSSYVERTDYGWQVGFFGGAIVEEDLDMTKSDVNLIDVSVRCVRGGPYFGESAVRFYISGANGQQIVLDRATGLVWQKEYATGKSWQQALAYCEGLNYGGYSDWRLPNFNELQSLVNYAKYSPASDFPDMPSDWFWSSSSWVGYVSYAWYVVFDLGYVFSDGKSNTYYARCVRGGP